ncbi:lipase family protein [Peribacillus sp. SCS-26]|uniref:lipase family protein n=1 Tax=Paraperibacillus marinus TaxID=3115295 RepID=UPI00390608D8
MTHVGNGFDAEVYKHKNQVAFRGGSKGVKDYVEDVEYIANTKAGYGDVSKIINGKKSQFLSADQLVKDVKDEYKDKNVTISVTGHSLGGALAGYTAARHNLEGVTYNARRVSSIFCRIRCKKR